jgi:hypothetical protein
MVLLLMVAYSASAQEDKRDVRRGNRDYKKDEFAEAEINYRKGIVKDTLSVPANYNLASSLYRQKKNKEALDVLQKQSVKELAAASQYGADYFYNLADAAIAMEEWQTAVDALQESLLRNPGDMNAKENYVYAKKKLQQQQQQQQNDQNQDDKNKNQSQNQQDQQNKDQQDQNKDKKDDDKDQNNDNKNQNQPKDQQGQQNPDQQPKISPQAAQQMLQAIQAKEKETQEKVKKEKAAVLQSRQKERNW